MAQALPVYAIAAVLLVASAGPVTSTVRDASLADFEDLDDPRPLDSFPFLEQVRAYLPPVVVEWLIVKKSLDLPTGGDFRVDDDGRVIIVWPDGCEETQASYATASVCDDDPCNDPDPDQTLCGDPCAGVDPDDDTDDACGSGPPIECEPGFMVGSNETGARGCVADPACDLPQDHPDRPGDCPPTQPPPEPEPTCADGRVEAYDGSCIVVAPRLLTTALLGSFSNNLNRNFELKVPYDNMSLHVTSDGFPPPSFAIKVFDAAQQGDNTICWVPEGGSGDRCTVEDNGALGGPTDQVFVDTQDGPIPAGNYTLSIEYTVNQPSSDSQLAVELYGMPADADTA